MLTTTESPHAYPRRILVAVTGLSPQIVTETLYALAVEPLGAAFIPTEVHLITTRSGAEKARLALLSDEPGWFHRLCHDYALPAIHFTPDTIHVLEGADGKPLDDIRSPADNRRAADGITALIREFTADPDCALHVSIAGGRKTMGFLSRLRAVPLRPPAGQAVTCPGLRAFRVQHWLLLPDAIEPGH
jgi:CRISPR-associated protein (TIGR02584 family)